jgi:hypothetical protein
MPAIPLDFSSCGRAGERSRLGDQGRRAEMAEGYLNRVDQDHRRGGCETGWLRVHGLA